MSISYNGAEILRKAGVENFSKYLKAQGLQEKRTHLEAAIKCFERAFKASLLFLTLRRRRARVGTSRCF